LSILELILRDRPAVPLEAPCIRPDTLARLTVREIAALTVWHGNEEARLGDFFEIRGDPSTEVRVVGETARIKHLGAGMAGGRLVIAGDAGMHVGAGMSGGHLVVEGSAAEWAGAEMSGGVLEIRGHAGHHLAGAYAGSRRGMTGGIVLVHGAAGDFAGERMRRGVIAVAGSVGAYAGMDILAGTLLVSGSLGRRAGAGLRRGTIVAGAAADLLPTFRYACTYRPGFLEIYLRRLRQGYGFPVEDRFFSGAYRRFIGDHNELGRGEILVWTPR